MNSLLPFALLAIAPCSAWASDFEFCEMAGQVTEVRAPEAGISSGFKGRVTVVSARRDPKEKGSYTDCSEYVGQPLDVAMRIPKKAGSIAIGDELTFVWSSIDGFDAQGRYVGTTTESRFRSLRKAGPHDEAGRR